MVKIESRKLTVEDCEALAKITKDARKNTPLESERSVEDITNSIEKIAASDDFHIITATNERGKFIGWTYYYIAFPSMAFISGSYPTVVELDNHEAVALSLIEASKSHIVDLEQHSRLEIELEFLTDAYRIYFERLVGWYTKCGFKFAAEEVHMKSNLSAIELPEIDQPQGYILSKFSEVSYDTLEDSGFRTLKNSKEGLFLSMSHAEQKVTLEYFFDKSRPYINDASLILEREGEIIGFVITRLNEDNEPEIGPVGIVPEARDKGLASYLLVRVLRNLRDSGETIVCLDTTITNHPAQKLYRKYGFQDVYYKQFYYWSP